LPFCRVSLKAARPSKISQDPQTWGDHIRKRRLELELRQKDVAQILAVDTSTITNWEKSYAKPHLYLVPKVIEFLGYDPMPIETKTLGQMLLRYRKSRGVTQKELAMQMGIDPTTLSRLERGQSTCFQTVLKKVNAFLNGRILSENCR
jgi:transcriptional regulator with XRE-family HTH domain